MKNRDIIFLIVVLMTSPLHSIVFSQGALPITFSEIMFSPSESNGEFVEIYNTSATETINLTGYKIKYYTSSNNNLVSFSGGTNLLPGKYAVIIQGSYDFANGLYKTLIPEGTVILKTSGNNFGSSGMANSTSRAVYLINASGQNVDTYTYSADNTAGYSDEKIEMTNDNSAANWANSQNQNGSPGFKNSVSPLSYDLSVLFRSENTSIFFAEESIKTTIVIKNIGKQSAGSFTVNLFDDMNYDSLGQAEEKIYSEVFDNLGVNDSILIEKNIFADSAKEYLLIAEVDYFDDEDLSNNKALKNISVAEKPAVSGEIVINEFMYTPTNDEPEWIELYNCSTRSLNLKNWKIGDNTTLINLSTNDLTLEPGGFLVISDDSSIQNYYSISSQIIFKSLPSLNNNGDEIRIKNEYQTTIDSVKYLSAWGGNNGKSLERISTQQFSGEDNWKTSESKHKATPGRINSVSVKDFDLSLNFLGVNESYAEKGKNIKINALIENQGIKPAENYLLKLFEDYNNNGIAEESEIIGRLIQQDLPAGKILESEFSLSFSDAGKKYITGVIDYENDQFGDNDSLTFVLNMVNINEVRNDIVVNEIMYSPVSPEPEWIELCNKSDKEINLKGYSVENKTTKSKILNDDKIMMPREILVVACDSSFFISYPDNNDAVITSFPTLNNSGDRIVLRDSLERVIDSLEYKSQWGGINGKSLERIDCEVLSTDSTNWKTCFLEKGRTPGKINSVSKKNYDCSVTDIIFNPIQPFAGNNIGIKTKLHNYGKYKIEFYVVLNEINNDGSKIIIEQSPQLSLLQNDSTEYEFVYKIPSINSKHTFEVVLVCPIDEEESNNSFYESVYPGYKQSAAIINEIMFNPVNGEPEWFELFNNSENIIDVSGWTITDVLTNPVQTNMADKIIQPQSYFVVTKDSSIFNYHHTIPSEILIGSFANLNNDTDGIVLKDYWGNTIDSVFYNKTWGGENGKSIERKSIKGISNEKNNWASSTDIELSTPGRRNSICKKEYDICLKEFYPDTNRVEKGKTANIYLDIENIGENDAVDLAVKIYRNAETIFSRKIDKIISADSIKYNLIISDMTVGWNKFTAVIEYNNDQNKSNDTLSCEIFCYEINEQREDVVINEIMFAPVSPEPEWIEIFNRSGKEINLKGYCIKDETTKGENIQSRIILKPGEYFVFGKDSSIYSVYPVAKNTLVVNFPSLGNTTDKIILCDSLNRVIDSLKYKSSWGGGGGKSLERIDCDVSSTDSTNWKTSKSANGGTPSQINSISLKNYDAAVSKILFSPSHPHIGDDVSIKAEIINCGKYDISAELVLYKVNDGSLEKYDKRVRTIKSGTEIEVEFTTKILSINSKQIFEVEVVAENDEDLSNNLLSSQISPGYVPGSVKINEIMYNPLNGEPEWIELFNNSDYDIDISDWIISDVLTNPVETKLASKVLEKKSFLVITKDSSIYNYHKSIPSSILVNKFANMNNDADGVVIKDAWNVTIDSVYYEKSWGGESGRSLERISSENSSVDKSNWCSSKDIELSTPGKANSTTEKVCDIAITKVGSHPQKPLVGENISIVASIKNLGEITASNISVDFYFIASTDTTFYDSAKIEKLAPNDSVDVFTSKTIKLLLPINVLCIVKLDDDQNISNNIYLTVIRSGYNRGDVLISEIMYNPFDDESEWVEIYNSSAYQINFENWFISDVVNAVKTKITDKENDLQPGEYAVITSDSASYPFYPPKNFVQSKFGSLNNSSDGIIISDINSGIIDSVVYNSDWGNIKGSSLERISFNAPSNDSGNWISSLCANGCTPGLKNSTTEVKTYDKNSLIINEIMFNPNENNSEFIEFYNPTDDSLQIGGMTVQVGSSQKILLSPVIFCLPSGSFYTLSADSNIFKNYSSIPNDDKSIYINNSLSLSDKGELVIRDIKGNIIDSLSYSSTWHNKNISDTKNRSLERLSPSLNSADPANWSSSVALEGATPGKQNSVFLLPVQSESKILISPNPFSPDNDGFEDFTTINFSLSKNLAQVRMKVFDSVGRLVRTLEQNMPTASHGTVIFNGLDNNNNALRIGIYILLIEVVAEDGSRETIKTPIVIARKL